MGAEGPTEWTHPCRKKDLANGSSEMPLPRLEAHLILFQPSLFALVQQASDEYEISILQSPYNVVNVRVRLIYKICNKFMKIAMCCIFVMKICSSSAWYHFPVMSYGFIGFVYHNHRDADSAHPSQTI